LNFLSLGAKRIRNDQRVLLPAIGCQVLGDDGKKSGGNAVLLHAVSGKPDDPDDISSVGDLDKSRD